MAVAGAIAAGVLAIGAEPAAADTLATTKTIGDACRVSFKAGAVNVSSTIEYWKGFRTWEGCPLWNVTICNYKSELGWYSPDGKTLYQTETWHAGWRGCSYTALKDWPGWKGRYVEDTRFKGKWASNHTPSGCCASNGDYHLFEIGVLKH